jgi:hypothetical protein
MGVLAVKLPHHSTPARLLGKQISKVNIFIALLAYLRQSKNFALHPPPSNTTPLKNNDVLIDLGMVSAVAFKDLLYTIAPTTTQQ